MAFFYGGGGAVLRGIQAKRVKAAEKALQAKVTNGSNGMNGMNGTSTPSVPGTPGGYVMPPVDLALQEVEEKLR